MLFQEKRQIESGFICCSGSLFADQSLSMNMVLANVSLITVDEASDTPTYSGPSRALATILAL
jgi:hypothetical protein